jgi:urease accessory protein
MKTSAAARSLALAALAVPYSAHAHHPMGGRTPGTLFEGLLSGLGHPVIGLDHFLFVLAIGAACYYFRQKTPATLIAFLAAAIAGAVLHSYTSALAYPDAWVAASLVVFGMLLLSGASFLKNKAAPGLFAIAGILHGYAYGETIVGAEPTPLLAYLAGFTAVQLLIALGGYAIARYVDRSKPSFQGSKALGGGLTVAGLAFAFLSLSGL